MKILSLNLANYTDHHFWPMRREMVSQWIKINLPEVILFQEDRFDSRESSTEKSYLGMVDQIVSGLTPEVDYHVFTSWGQCYDLATGIPVNCLTSCREGVSTLVRSDLTCGPYSELKLLGTSLSDTNHRVLTQIQVGSLTFTNVHLSYDENLTRSQIKSGLDWTGPNSLWLGDFNVKWDQIYDLFPDHIDVWSTLHPNKSGYTYPSNSLEKRIDLALVPKNLKHKVTRVERVFDDSYLGIYPSDHLGLCLEIDS